MKLLLFVLLITSLLSCKHKPEIYLVRAFKNTGNWDSGYLYSDGHLIITEKPDTNYVSLTKGEVIDNNNDSAILKYEFKGNSFYFPTHKPMPYTDTTEYKPIVKVLGRPTNGSQGDHGKIDFGSAYRYNLSDVKMGFGYIPLTDSVPKINIDTAYIIPDGTKYEIQLVDEKLNGVSKDMKGHWTIRGDTSAILEYIYQQYILPVERKRNPSYYLDRMSILNHGCIGINSVNSTMAGMFILTDTSALKVVLLPDDVYRFNTCDSIKQ